LDYSNCDYPVNHWKPRDDLEVWSVLGFISMQTLTEKEWKILMNTRESSNNYGVSLLERDCSEAKSL